MIKKILIIIFLSFALLQGSLFGQACCVGNSYDIAVVPLTKTALFNLGFNFENYYGSWDPEGVWTKTTYTSYQMRYNAAAAYRFNKSLQVSAYIPLIYNRNEIPGNKPDGFGFGDASVSGRFELTHEFEMNSINGKRIVDDKTPYIAATFGLIFPTGISDETAITESEITGKGTFSSLLGLSFIKSIKKEKFQLGLDLNWQHNFSKTYEKYFGQAISNSFTKKLGDKYNFSITTNYMFSEEHNVTFAFGGFLQSNLSIDGTVNENTSEKLLNFSLSYSYYPTEKLRFSPAFKWNIFSDNFGKNTSGSLIFTLNAIYYIGS